MSSSFFISFKLVINSMMKLLELPKQTSPEEIDEEILDIFVEEVNEVLDEIINNFESWKDEPTNIEALKVVRRCFHTLKGSGRLVGATVIGELGWRFENMLNRVIDGTIQRSDAMLSIVEKVQEVLPSMVEQFKQNQPPPYIVALLISQAHYLTETKGKSLGEFEPPPEGTPSLLIVPTPKIETSPVPQTKKVAAQIETEEPEEEVEFEAIELDEEEEQDISLFNELKLPEVHDEEQDESFLSEATSFEESAELNEDNIGFNPLSQEELDLAENIDSVEMPDFSLDVDKLPDIDVQSEHLSEEENTFPEEKTFPHTSTDVGTIKDTIESIDAQLFEIFKKESSQHLSNLNNILNRYEGTSFSSVDQEILRIFHTLNGSSLSVGMTTISEIAAPLESYCRALSDRHIAVPKDRLSLFYKAKELVESLLKAQTLNEEEQQTLLDDIQMALEALPLLPKIVNKPTDSTLDQIAPPDASGEFMSIFLEEAEEILENTQSLVERWHSAPHNMQLIKELQRELHTLKGGARMVGITAVGDLSHSLESVLTKIVEGGAQSNQKLQELVQNSVDELAAMREAVRSGVPLEVPHDLISQINGALAPAGEEEGGSETSTATSGSLLPALQKVTVPPPPPKVFPEEPVDSQKHDDPMGEEDRIRVRVALIDKLTNLAGELSISRAHMEQQQAAVKTNVVEMEQTIARLRDQLRRLEIETEAQILSHYRGIEKRIHEEFDPLEMDRFSLIQQLSRSLMESISDLVSIQDFLKVLSRQTDTLLIQQTRIGAELQDVIMRTRMIPFSRISPRLQRIVRLTARELRKQVDFVINGENIEFERTVLNRMVAPLEHMLRNAIGHGIEEASARQQSGKAPVAKITIDITKEGSELVLRVRDDGAGLDLGAIRKKAEEKQMIKPNTVIGDQELMQFILEPSFTTAKVVTQIAGRGVGMDVVNNEIKQLGGTLLIHSKAGEGTMFEIRLPLSLTINQALLVHVGEETLAVPMNNVDAVLRVPRNEALLNHSEEIRYHKYMGNAYRVFHLGELLGFGKNSSVDMPLVPMLLIRAADRRVALVVDGIEGNKEIVVKSVGLQIGAIRWITGATILGDGRVVIILDVPTLTRVDKREQVSSVKTVVLEEVKAKETSLAKTIMVVDDSITVRKVTARLLKRQGMEVLTAKDGVDAVSQLQEHIPDLMLLDVEMPRMDGYELATQIRNSPELKHIPIIMITSRTGAKHRDRAEKIGINRYLGKPFNETELLEIINILLKEGEVHKSH